MINQHSWRLSKAAWQAYIGGKEQTETKTIWRNRRFNEQTKPEEPARASSAFTTRNVRADETALFLRVSVCSAPGTTNTCCPVWRSTVKTTIDYTDSLGSREKKPEVSRKRVSRSMRYHSTHNYGATIMTLFLAQRLRFTCGWGCYTKQTNKNKQILRKNEAIKTSTSEL